MCWTSRPPALDPVAEYEIYTRLQDITGQRSSIFISHRLASCRFCDEIAVFDRGHLVEYGAHETLLARHGGKYAELWQAQANTTAGQAHPLSRHPLSLKRRPLRYNPQSALFCHFSVSSENRADKSCKIPASQIFSIAV